MKDLSASWTALSTIACWVVCYGVRTLLLQPGCQYIHFEWKSYRWQFTIAYNTLDAENNLFNFRVFRILDTQFPASIASHFHRSAKFFDTIGLLNQY